MLRPQEKGLLAGMATVTLAPVVLGMDALSVAVAFDPRGNGITPLWALALIAFAGLATVFTALAGRAWWRYVDDPASVDNLSGPVVIAWTAGAAWSLLSVWFFGPFMLFGLCVTVLGAVTVLFARCASRLTA